MANRAECVHAVVRCSLCNAYAASNWNPVRLAWDSASLHASWDVSSCLNEHKQDLVHLLQQGRCISLCA